MWRKVRSHLLYPVKIGQVILSPLLCFWCWSVLRVEVVVQKAELGHLLVFCSWSSVVGVGIDADAASWREDSRHFDVFRIHQFDEVLHDNVDTIFVEVAMVSEAKQVEFQALAFHHFMVGEIVDAYFSEVGLPCDGAEAGELRAVEAHPIVVARVFVFKALEDFWGVVVAVFRGFA